MENITILTPDVKLGFVGAGNMARAIVEGILREKLCRPSHIYISHPSAIENRKFADLEIDNEVADNNFVVQNSDIILLCVKPQILKKVCESLRDSIDFERHLIVSVVAGISLEKITEYIIPPNEDADENHKKLRLARLTLNLAAQLGLSSSNYSQNGNLSIEDKQFIEDLLSGSGLCAGEIKDQDMAASMALSGCALAYMYMMVDALADGGVKMGLTREMALKLSMQTMKGASEVMLQNFKKKHPAQLKDEVCSPGGTTIQGVHELERNGFRNSIICAVEAATKRAKQF